MTKPANPTHPPNPPYPLVYVEWDDSFGVSSRWEAIPNDYPTPKSTMCQSVGWLVYDGKKYKVVVPHLTGPEGDTWSGCGDMTIPVGVIVRIIRLRSPARHVKRRRQ